MKYFHPRPAKVTSCSVTCHDGSYSTHVLLSTLQESRLLATEISLCKIIHQGLYHDGLQQIPMSSKDCNKVFCSSYTMGRVWNVKPEKWWLGLVTNSTSILLPI